MTQLKSMRNFVSFTCVENLVLSSLEITAITNCNYISIRQNEQWFCVEQKTQQLNCLVTTFLLCTNQLIQANFFFCNYNNWFVIFNSKPNRSGEKICQLSLFRILWRETSLGVNGSHFLYADFNLCGEVEVKMPWNYSPKVAMNNRV